MARSKLGFAQISALAIGPLSLSLPFFEGLLGAAIASGLALATVARFNALASRARREGLRATLPLLVAGPALLAIVCLTILALWPRLAPTAFLGASWGLFLSVLKGLGASTNDIPFWKRARLQFMTVRPKMFQMRKKAGLLLGLVGSELNDLLEDIKDLESLYLDRYEKSEISNYVFLENSAMLEKEMKCIERLKGRLGAFGPETADSLEGLAEAVKADFLKELDVDAAPEALGQMVVRRIDKALRYCASKE